MLRRSKFLHSLPSSGKSSFSSDVKLPIFSGSAPDRMMRGIKAKEAAKANKRASDAFDNGEITNAINEWEGAVKQLKSCGLGEDACILEPMNNLACALGEIGRGKEKLEMLNEHCGLTKTVYGENHPQYVVALYNHAAALGDVGRPKEMLQEMERILELQKAVLPPLRRDKHPKVARVMLGLADAYGKVGDFDRRWKYLRDAMPIVVNHLTCHHPQVAAVYLALCDASIDLWYSRRRFGDKVLTPEEMSGLVTAEDIILEEKQNAENTKPNESKSVEELQQEKTDRVVSRMFSPRNPTECAKQGLLFARKAFEIESKVIPATSSHLLTHSRLALARSRSALSPQLSFLDIAPFIGDIRNDVIRHTNETGKLLIPVLAFAAQDATRRVVLDEVTKSNGVDRNDLIETALAMSEGSFQVSIRHFEATGHLETPRRLIEQAAVAFGCAMMDEREKTVSKNDDDAESAETKIHRWCNEGIRRLDALGAESDLTLRISAEKMKKMIDQDAKASKNKDLKKDILEVVRETLKF